MASVRYYAKNLRWERDSHRADTTYEAAALDVHICAQPIDTCNINTSIYILSYLKLTILQDEIRLDHIHRGRCLYTCSKQNMKGCEVVLEESHYHIILVPWYCGFILVNLVYSTLLIIILMLLLLLLLLLLICDDSEGDQYQN